MDSQRKPWSAEDPEFPKKDWAAEVQANDTELGYSDWLRHKKESKQDDES